MKEHRVNIQNLKLNDKSFSLGEDLNVAIISTNDKSQLSNESYKDIINKTKFLFIIGCPIARGTVQKELESTNNIKIKYYKSNEMIPEFTFILAGENKNMVFNKILLNKLKFKKINDKSQLLIFLDTPK